MIDTIKVDDKIVSLGKVAYYENPEDILVALSWIQARIMGQSHKGIRSTKEMSVKYKHATFDLGKRNNLISLNALAATVQENPEPILPILACYNAKTEVKDVVLAYPQKDAFEYSYKIGMTTSFSIFFSWLLEQQCVENASYKETDIKPSTIDYLSKIYLNYMDTSCFYVDVKTKIVSFLDFTLDVQRNIKYHPELTKLCIIGDIARQCVISNNQQCDGTVLVTNTDAAFIEILSDIFKNIQFIYSK